MRLSLPACGLRTCSCSCIPQRPASGSGVQCSAPQSHHHSPRPHRLLPRHPLRPHHIVHSPPQHKPGSRLRFRSHSLIPRPPPWLTPENSQDRQAPRDVPGIFPKPPIPLSPAPTVQQSVDCSDASNTYIVQYSVAFLQPTDSPPPPHLGLLETPSAHQQTANSALTTESALFPQQPARLARLENARLCSFQCR